MFFYNFFYGRLILRPWLTEVRESFTRGGPWAALEKLLLGFFPGHPWTTGWAKKWRNLAYFQTGPANFLLSRPNAAEYCNSEKNSLSRDGCCTRNATFRRELWPTNLWDQPAPLLFWKTKRLQHVLFPFAMWQHCCYVHCWEGRHSLALNISQTAGVHPVGMIVTCQRLVLIAVIMIQLKGFFCTSLALFPTITSFI